MPLNVTVENYKVIKPNRISYDLVIPQKLKKYFRDCSLYVDYDVDVKDVDTGVLYIPIVAVMAPISWAIGFDLHVPILDENFFNSLRNVGEIFKKYYPKLHSNVKIVPKALSHIKGKFIGRKFALLFSGGVDSTYSLIMRLSEKPNLITILDLDFSSSPRTGIIKMVKNSCSNIALRHRLEINFIRTNLRRFVNESRLELEFGVNFTESWWGGYAHTINMVGLVAPLTIRKNINVLLVSSTHSKEFRLPWADLFLMNSVVKYGFTEVVLTDHSLSRFQKIMGLKDYIRRNGPIHIRVCWRRPETFNCNECEKCIRTIIALIIAGINPEEVGFKLGNPGIFLINVKNRLKTAIFDENSTYFWRDLQKHVPENLENYPPYIRDFLTKFKDYRIIERKRIGVIIKKLLLRLCLPLHKPLKTLSRKLKLQPNAFFL
ncbi:MAG: hypothetical protein QW589_03680 [Candidatus Bathyarchaeia archaeon]